MHQALSRAWHVPALARYWKTIVAATCVVFAVAIGAIYWQSNESPNSSEERSATPTTPAQHEPAPTPTSESPAPASVTLPPSQWASAGVEVAPAAMMPFAETVHLTGKVSLDEDRIAHIYPMVEGAVESVAVRLGQQVKAGDAMVVVHSREVGQAKLALYQARLVLEMAQVQDGMQREIVANTRELLAVLRERQAIEAIESQFRNRGMGDYRERLLASYSNYVKSAADVERLSSIADSGAISGKQMVAARAAMNADQATFQSRIEQVDYELTTALLTSSQAVKQAATEVAVATASLRILGCREEEIARIDPDIEGEAVSHYSIRAPFDGTVIAKDVALGEQIRPDTQLFSIANLSTVWITADIYEQNVPLLGSLAGKKVKVHNTAWPDRVFEAEVFFTGEIMDESTRTISLRAVADNADRLLKPGMFVTIEINSPAEGQSLAIPTSALQEYEGQQFVFVQVADDQFERRDVKAGVRNSDVVVIDAGLTAGERVATRGGFVLKSKMLEALMGEE
ncbi:efflux RND transporter periplasmic adaptor subunit [Aeoliella sp. SH292]|uniref:efflux RND transporter periplasmic adaptor subunit n=1 Tax=Aeoliella sp. SH292 TaxID=3454464 RepID=UPI003F98B7D4